MKYTAIVFFIFITVLISCKNNSTDTPQTQADTTTFFQVNKFIGKDIDEVNKTPYFIYQIVQSGEKKDSTPITLDKFNQLAAGFTHPDITDKSLKPRYKENIFQDQTTNGFTITYSTNDKDLEVQNIEILLKDDGETVKRIFIRKFINYNDSSAIEQLSWKPGESFQINRSVEKPGSSEVITQTSVVWNHKD